MWLSILVYADAMLFSALLLYFSVEEQAACSLLVVALHWQNDIGMAAQNKQQQKERHVKN
jgi:hypothetical protein